MERLRLVLFSSVHWTVLVPAGIASFLILYTLYYRVFHPLANYPGPFLASITNLWKVYYLFTLHLPDRLAALHDQYGEVVRVGPNDLSFRTDNAYSQIYKGGRSLPKTGFYNGFTAFNPNLFGTQDEEVRSHGLHFASRNCLTDNMVENPDTRSSTASNGARILDAVHQGNGALHRPPSAAVA